MLFYITHVMFQCLQAISKHIDASLQIHPKFMKICKFFKNVKFSIFLSRQKSIFLTSHLPQFMSNHPKLFPASPQMFGDALWYHTGHISMLTNNFKAHRRQLTTPSKIHENMEIFQKCEIFKFFVAPKVHFPDEYELQNYFPCLWKCSKYVLQDQ